MQMKMESKLVESPYKAKATEKYPVKVKNMLVSKDFPAAATASDPQPPSSPDKAQNYPPAADVSMSPASRSKSPHKTGKIAVKSTTSSISPRGGYFGAAPGGEFFSSNFAHDTSLASGLAGSLDAPGSPYRLQNLQDYESPAVGGAVKSSFLTELGLLRGAEPSGLDEAYKPPRGVSQNRLVGSLLLLRLLCLSFEHV